MIRYKICKSCNVLLPHGDFTKHINNVTRRMEPISECRKCVKDNKNEYYKEWYQSKKEYRKDKYKNYQNTPYGMRSRYSRYQYNAKKRGYLFNIKYDEFIKIISLQCNYCNEDGGGVDRVDNDIGYILNNCVPCCKTCNWMKTNNTLDEFIRKCKVITKHNE